MAISQIKKSPKAFYAYAKRFAKTFSGVAPLINNDGEIISKPEEIAEELRKQYEGVYSQLIKNRKVDNAEHFFLAIIWNKSLETGEIPPIFKLTFVTPVHKMGS